MAVSASVNCLTPSLRQNAPTVSKMPDMLQHDTITLSSHRYPQIKCQSDVCASNWLSVTPVSVIVSCALRVMIVSPWAS